ncbi:MAG: lytic transglycosylase domain-containing protein [Firmicutes bacterium]|nr:lytic transglycosylase domain-containing protein [Bacillota bacterium]
MKHKRRQRMRPATQRPKISWAVALFLCLAVGTGALLARLTIHQNTPTRSDLLPPLAFLPVYVRAAQMYHVPWAFLATINEIETNYDRVHPMISSAGAVGPMQFMPSTWREYGANVLHPAREGDPMDLLDAVFACAKLLHVWGMTPKLTNAYWIARFAGAYDAGPGRWNNDSVETVHYRQTAVRLYHMIRRDVIIPQSVVTYWDQLSLQQIADIAAGRKDVSAGLRAHVREDASG